MDFQVPSDENVYAERDFILKEISYEKAGK
jgi:hypothetical protein